MNLKWRAVYCKPRQESRAYLNLLNQEYDVFLPRLRSRKRIRGADTDLVEPMFPRYLFIALADYRHDWSPIRSTRGVVGLVRLGDEVPIVPADLIEELKTRHDEGGAVDVTAAGRFKQNDPVEITAGPFAGYRGLFEAATGKHRAAILLEILNQQRRIQIPNRDFQKTAT
ncbi:MAG: transcription/translation regulatory transformer protein RfaH [Wenzhouxiangellaceae bacterium]|nr:transcription/translation regulatory transformer protein RfaH [Wenzhouxiangellaceae bacterium]